MNNYIQINNVIKEFDNGEIKALRGINLTIEKGEFIAIMGPSGCGKSTLLNMIGALDKPTNGTVIVNDKNLSEFKDLSEYRAKTIGFIFQLHNLIPSLTAVENVQIPLFGFVGRKERQKRAIEILEKIGLGKRKNNLPTKLSGGERQKVAVARALINNSEIIIADEPTGNLDSESGKVIMELLKKIHNEKKITIILVTHDPQVASYADRIIKMVDGKIV